MDQNGDKAQPAPQTSDSGFGRRAIRSILPLQIYYLDENGRPKPGGSTLAVDGVEPPAAETWWISPLRTLTEEEWESVFAMMEKNRIPGLSAERQMTDALLERLSRLDHLTYLGAPGSQITDSGLKYLSRLPKLEHLDLTFCPITDGGLDVLGHLPHLKSFKLVHSPGVTDAGLTALAQCPKLERVNLMGTNTGDGVIRALVGKPRLRHFASGNGVTDAGLALLREFPVFKTWQGGEIAMGLMQFNASPNSLLLRGTFTDAGMAHLAGLDGLFALNLDNNKLAVTAEGLKSLIELPHLGWLAFDAKDDSMPVIAAMPHLRFLMCQDTAAGEDGFKSLSRSQSLEYLWGRRCYSLNGRGFAAMAAIPTLRGLSASCKNVDDAGLAMLPCFPALREFMPMDVPDDGFRHVGRCDQLEALYCMYCDSMTDAATEHLKGLSRLKEYQAWSVPITDRSLEILSRLTALERITLYNCPGITDEGFAALATLPRLEAVTLETLPNVTAGGMSAFPAHVKVNAIT